MAENKLDIPAVCRQAVDLAAKEGILFDYSPESIGGMDVMLAGQHALYKKGQLTDIYVWNLSVMFGIYLGQTLMFCGLREHGFDWVTDESGVPKLYRDDQNFADVIGQVRMCIMHGEEYSTSMYFARIITLIHSVQ